MEIDLTDRTTDSLFEEIVSALGDDAHARHVADELRRRCQEADELFYLPLAVEDKIRTTFGPGDQTFQAMTRRCRFAMKVWQGKYGNFNPEQAAYAESVLLYAISAANGLHGAKAKREAAYGQLSRVVNHERTDEGFKRRAKTVDVTVDLMEALA